MLPICVVTSVSSVTCTGDTVVSLDTEEKYHDGAIFETMMTIKNDIVTEKQDSRAM